MLLRCEVWRKSSGGKEMVAEHSRPKGGKSVDGFYHECFTCFSYAFTSSIEMIFLPSFLLIKCVTLVDFGRFF